VLDAQRRLLHDLYRDLGWELPRHSFAAYAWALGPVVSRSRSIGPRVIGLIIPLSRTQIWITAQAIHVLPHHVRRSVLEKGRERAVAATIRGSRQPGFHAC
jgi:hypothetical protein